VVVAVGKLNFGEVGFFGDNRLKQKKMLLPVIGQLRISGLGFLVQADVTKF
jgi:hypothetical protein